MIRGMCGLSIVDDDLRELQSLKVQTVQLSRNIRNMFQEYGICARVGGVGVGGLVGVGGRGDSISVSEIWVFRKWEFVD